MGMFNAGSTLYAIYSQKVIVGSEPKDVSTDLKQSSDDSEQANATLEEDVNKARENLIEALYVSRLKYFLASINVSVWKEITSFDLLLGELTSQYHTTRHWGNVSVELPAFIPQCVNPVSDFAMAMRLLHQSATKGNLEFSTAFLVIELFTRYFDFGYETKEWSHTALLNRAIREKHSNNVMYANGGTPVFSPSVLSFSEIALRRDPPPRLRGEVITPLNLEYLEALLQTNEPMPEEQDVLVEGRQPIHGIVKVPHNVYNLKLRRNEKTQGRLGPLAVEREAMRQTRMIRAADASWGIVTNKNTVSVGQDLVSSMFLKIEKYRRSGGAGATAMWDYAEKFCKKHGMKTGHGGMPFPASTEQTVSAGTISPSGPSTLPE